MRCQLDFQISLFQLHVEDLNRWLDNFLDNHMLTQIGFESIILK